MITTGHIIASRLGDAAASAREEAAARRREVYAHEYEFWTKSLLYLRLSVDRATSAGCVNDAVTFREALSLAQTYAELSEDCYLDEDICNATCPAFCRRAAVLQVHIPKPLCSIRSVEARADTHEDEENEA